MYLSKFVISYTFLRVSYQVFAGLIPRPSEGCPEKTIGCDAPGCPTTCFCEDHCSWERCSLTDPPMECLDDMNGEWKRGKNAWVAKFRGI